MTKKLILAACLVLALLGVAACGGGSGGDQSSDQSSSSQEKSTKEAAKPDLDDVPKVVAEVNGQKIYKSEFVQAYKGQFQQMAMQAQATGQKPDQDKLKKQVAESLVGTELLTQEAQKRGYKATPKDVDKTLQGLAAQNGMKSKKQVLDALEKQGMSKAQIMAQAKTQTKVDELVAEESGNTKPTQKQLKQLYAQMKAQQQQSGQKAPSFKKMRPQLEQQAESQQQMKTAQALIKRLRKHADVTIHV